MWSSAKEVGDYPDEATPTSEQDYQGLASKWWTQLEQFKNNSGWVETDLGIEGVSFYQKDVPGFTIPMLQIKGILPGTPEEVCKFQDICTDEERTHFDPQIKSHDHIEDISDSIAVVAVVYSGVFPVSERDFVAFRSYKTLPDGTWVSLGHTINHKSRPVMSSPVRAKGKMGMYCEPVPGKPYETMCSKFVLVDPMGNIPAWLIKMAQTQAVKGHVKMAEVLEKRYGQSHRPKDLIPTPLPTPLPSTPSQDDDFEFFDIIDYSEDFDVIDESCPITRFEKTSSTMAIAKTDPGFSLPAFAFQSTAKASAQTSAVASASTAIETSVKQDTASIMKELHENAKAISSRLQKLEQIQNSQKGIFLSWTKFLVLLGWPVFVIFVYHFFRRRFTTARGILTQSP